MNSTRLRQIEATEVVKFKEGEKCLARWTDSRKFPGTVSKVLENGEICILETFVFGYFVTQFCFS